MSGQSGFGGRSTDMDTISLLEMPKVYKKSAMTTLYLLGNVVILRLQCHVISKLAATPECPYIGNYYNVISYKNTSLTILDSLYFRLSIF